MADISGFSNNANSDESNGKNLWSAGYSARYHVKPFTKTIYHRVSSSYQFVGLKRLSILWLGILLNAPLEGGDGIPTYVYLTPLLLIPPQQSLSPKPRKVLEVIMLRLEIFLQQEIIQ